MKWETKTRERELPGMEALSFTVLVAHNGVGVAVAGYGGRHWFSFFSPLFRCVIFFLCFLFPCQQCSCLSRWLCGGDVGVSSVVGGGKEEDWWWYAKDAALVSLYFLFLPPAFCWCFSLLFVFFCLFFVHSSLSLSLSFSFFFLFSSVPLS
jgi:hypothetical protein